MFGQGPPPDGPAPQRRRKRRGTVPLVLGLVMLLLLAPATLIIGIAVAINGIASEAAAAPTPMSGSQASVEMQANQMLVVYVPEADADTAECTAEATEPDSITTVSSGGSVQFDGENYQQHLAVGSLADTTVDISCTGTTADAVYVGPYSLFGVAVPLLIGIIGGVVLGLIGLLLLVIGIVMKVRTSRS